MSAKQIRFFGTKRQKAALRKKRSAAHRPRTKPKHNTAHKTKKKAVARHPKSSAHKKRTKNPAEIIAWTVGNPARKKGKKAMAKKHKKKAVARHNRAGRSKKTTRHKKHRNPGFLGSPMDWVQGGAGVLVGVAGARAIPQMILAEKNTGPMGYLANAISAVALGWVTHMIFPHNRLLTGAVVAGGFAATFSRVISDQTPFGKQLSLSGLGDWGLGLYQKSNFPYPPRLQNGRGPGSSMFTWGDGSQVGMPIATAASGGSDSTGAC